MVVHLNKHLWHSILLVYRHILLESVFHQMSDDSSQVFEILQLLNLFLLIQVVLDSSEDLALTRVVYKDLPSLCKGSDIVHCLDTESFMKHFLKKESNLIWHLQVTLFDYSKS